MPGRKVQLVTEEYYHVFNRGVNKRPIFQDASNYRRCLDQMNYYRHKNTPIKFSRLITLKPELKYSVLEAVLKSPKHVEILAYCLMPNHIHLLVKQTSEGGVSKFMSKFQNSYSRYFNIRTNRTGPLLTGKFQAVRIETDEQLLHVSRYIHLNPITSSLVKTFNQLKKYKWSSFTEYYCSSENKICNPKLILDFFNSKKHYSRFLNDQVDYQRQLNQLKHLNLE